MRASGRQRLVVALGLWLVASAAAADEPGERPAQVEVEGGQISVVISPEAQSRLALQWLRVGAATAPATSGAVARVVDIADLLALRQDYLQSGIEQAAARRRAAAAVAQASRLASLRSIGAVVSPEQQQAVETALDAARTDGELAAARGAAASQRLEYAWGKTLAAAARAITPGLLEDLARRRTQLLLISLPAEAAWPVTAGQAVYESGAPPSPQVARLLDAAPVAAGAGGGRWAVTDNPDLRTGMRLDLQLSDGPVLAGARVPARALVWHGGQQWCYVRAAPERFERRAASGRALGDGDLLVTGLAADSEVVVQGAQSLLGEELRWSIPAEGDD